MTEQRIAGWTSPSGDITIQVWDPFGNLFQVREFSHLGSFGGNVIEPYATADEAIEIAVAKAEIIRWNQTGR
jgi:hypothetical protein